MKCGSCGTESPGGSFCVHCGKPFVPTVNPMRPAAQVSPIETALNKEDALQELARGSRPRVALAVGLLVGAAVATLAAFGVWSLTSDNSGSAGDSVEASEGSPRSESDSRLDALWEACAEGDFESCDDLFLEAPSGSSYEDFGDSCGNRNEPAGYCVDIYASETSPAITPGGDGYGTDPGLDALWDDCEAGDYSACDDLFFAAEYGTEYSDFGDSCGYRNEPAGYCENIYGSSPEGSSTSTGSYGSDSYLDLLWDLCEAGDFASCDDLYIEAPRNSEYEYFGDSCGYRNEPAGYCESIYG